MRLSIPAAGTYAIIAALALGLAACSSGDDSSTDAGTGQSTESSDDGSQDSSPSAGGDGSDDGSDALLAMTACDLLPQADAAALGFAEPGESFGDPADKDGTSCSLGPGQGEGSPLLDLSIRTGTLDLDENFFQPESSEETTVGDRPAIRVMGVERFQLAHEHPSCATEFEVSSDVTVVALIGVSAPSTATDACVLIDEVLPTVAANVPS